MLTAGFLAIVAAAFAVISEAIMACWIIASSAAAAAARDAAADSVYGVPLAAEAARHEASIVSDLPPVAAAVEAAPPLPPAPPAAPLAGPPAADAAGAPFAAAGAAFPPAAAPPAAAAPPEAVAVAVGELIMATPRNASPFRRAARLSSRAHPSGICRTVRRKMAAESCTNLGRALLWSPGTSSRFLSPEYFA